jgi:hypothetical protein
LVAARALLPCDWLFEPTVILTDLCGRFTFFEFVPTSDKDNLLHNRKIKMTIATSNSAGLAYARSLLERTLPKINEALTLACSEDPGGGHEKDPTGGLQTNGSVGPVTLAHDGVASPACGGAASASNAQHGGSDGGRSSTIGHYVQSDWAQIAAQSTAEKENADDNIAAYDEADNALTLVRASDAFGALVRKSDMVRALGFDSVTAVTVTYRGEQLTRPYAF